MAEVPGVRDHPNVIARPPLIYLGLLGLGLLLDWAWPLAEMAWSWRYPVAAACLASGAALVTLALRRFKAAGTSVQTRRPTTEIVRDGPYRYSRNPIYLGLTAIYIGLALAAGSGWSLALLLPLLLVIRFGVIAREERYLAAKFGDEYRRYTAAVRRWI